MRVELQQQLDAQAELLLQLSERLAELLEVPAVPVRHAALLPEVLAASVTLAVPGSALRDSRCAPG